MEATVDKDKSQPVRITHQNVLKNLHETCKTHQTCTLSWSSSSLQRKRSVSVHNRALSCRACCLWRCHPTETHLSAIRSKWTSTSLMARGSGASLNISPTHQWHVRMLLSLFVVCIYLTVGFEWTVIILSIIIVSTLLPFSTSFQNVYSHLFTFSTSLQLHPSRQNL